MAWLTRLYALFPAIAHNTCTQQNVFSTLTILQINHVHLISGHRLPISAQLGLEGAYRYLLDAPQIVKQVAPMSWTYVAAPQDGTLWLEWLSPDRTNDRFPSDGYVWADQEHTFRQNYGGFEIEVMVHSLGYRPGYDSVATHARTRYHFVSKNPNHNAPPPDPQLWIVHYHQTEPQRHIPTQQIPPNQQTQQILRERAWLERQGRIEKKDFMLHDREHWPTINVPNTRQQPMPQPNTWPPQQPQYSRFPNAYPQQPPAKRQRQQAPPVMPGTGEAAQDTSVEDEENTTLGDYFDHLTPRDISMARYIQHHRWMEEVFSSPYASHQIVPADLGLGLMGELKGLTDGILDPPSLDFLERPDKPSKPKESQPFTNLKQGQLDEFNKRVNKHLEDGQAEIERMKTEHAARMQEWKKSKTLMQAEKRLRYATWEGHESAVSGHQLQASTNGDGNTEHGIERVDDVVKEVQSILGVTITSHKDADIIERGGLEDEVEVHRDEVIPDTLEVPRQQPQALPSDTPSVAKYQQDHMPSAQVQAETQVGQAQPLSQTSPQANHQNAHLPTTSELSGDHLLNANINTDDSIMDDMDLDVNDVGVDFGGDESLVDPAQAQPTASPAVAAPAPPATVPFARPPPPPPTNPDPTSASTSTAQHQSDHTAHSAPVHFPNPTAESNIFADSTFDDLTNMDGHEGDDGLIDFDGGVGLEDSAFGDALHGMEGDGGSAS